MDKKSITVRYTTVDNWLAANTRDRIPSWPALKQSH